MLTGISFTLTGVDRRRLKSIVSDRNTPQKHVWRAEIVLLSTDGLGTHAIMRATGKSKTCVWRWQERFADEGVDGLLRDIEASHAIGSSGCAETDPRGLHLLNNQSSTRLSL
jgi:hypothetical protein